MKSLVTAICAGLALLLVVSSARSQGTRRRAGAEGPVVSPSATTSGGEKRLAEAARALNTAWAEFRRTRFDKAREAVDQVLEADRRQPVCRFILREIHIERGEWDQARAVQGSVSRSARSVWESPTPLAEWQVIGPFRNGGPREFEKELGPEKGYDPKASYRGDGRICRWKAAKGPRVDFRDALEVEGPAVAYGRTEFLSRRAGWIALGVGSEDGIRIWLNGDLVHDHFVRRDIREDDDMVFAWVPRGRNELIVKVDSRGDDFRCYVQVYESLEVPRSRFLDRARAGAEAIEKRKWDEAEALLLEAEAERPDNAEVSVLIAEAKLGQGQPISARAWASRALALRPSSARGLVVYARSMLALGETLRAFDAFRAAYRASDLADEATFAAWVESARERRWTLQEGLALLDRARGLAQRKDETGAARELEKAAPLLESSFVGLAELSLFHREAGDRDRAAELGLRAVNLLTPEQIALHLSAEWLLDLVKSLRETRPQDAAARERLLRLVEQVDPTRSDLIRELLASGGTGSAVSERVEELLSQRPEKSLYKEYVHRLFDAGDHERCVRICRQGLEAGIVSRTLRYKQAYSLLALHRYDEAEEVFTGLLEEKDYVERAKAGLLAVARAREGADVE